MSLVLNQKEACGAWAMSKMPHILGIGSWGQFEAIGWEKGGELQAVVVYNFYTGIDMAMHIAAVPGKQWLTRHFLRAAFAYPFVQLGCRRVTGYVPASQLDVIEFDKHLGFVENGYLPHALRDDDLVVLGMLREQCRFLTKREIWLKERKAA